MEDTDLIDHMILVQWRLLGKLQGRQGVCLRNANESFLFYGATSQLIKTSCRPIISLRLARKDYYYYYSYAAAPLKGMRFFYIRVFRGGNRSGRARPDENLRRYNSRPSARKMLSHNVVFPLRGPNPHRSKGLVT